MADRFKVLFFSIFLLVVSCDDRHVYEVNNAIPSSGWDMNEPVKFIIDVIDTSRWYNLYINTRNRGDYNFSNLFVFIRTQTPSGITQNDTAEVVLAKSSGKWIGSGIGDLYAIRTLFIRKFKFNEPGIYQFDINQAMRINPLIGIEDIGLRLEYAE